MTITILLSGKQDKVTAIALAVATLVPKAVSERESNKTDAQYTNDLLDQIADEVSEMGLGEYATERLMDIIGSYKEECDPDELDHMVEEAEYAATVSEMRDTIVDQEKRIHELNATIQTIQHNHNNDIAFLKETVRDTFCPLNTKQAKGIDKMFESRKWKNLVTGEDIEESRRISLVSITNNHNNAIQEFRELLRETPMSSINRTPLLRLADKHTWDLPD